MTMNPPALAGLLFNPEAARLALAALRATNAADHVSPVPPDLPESARRAREVFDLDAEIEAHQHLRYEPFDPAVTGATGGIRLRRQLKASISDGLLREFAQMELGAVRCSREYLGALRIVLGNQADAEQKGYLLELNVRVSFATTKTMRTILGQMQTAGILKGVPVGLGTGRRQVVQTYGEGLRGWLPDRTSRAVAEKHLGDIMRRAEEQSDTSAASMAGPRRPAAVPASIQPEDVPY